MLQFILITLGIIIGLLISKLDGYNYLINLLNYTEVLFYYLILLNFTSFSLLEIIIYQNKITSLQILEINQDLNMRCLKFVMVNNNHLEGKELFKGIYSTLMSDKEFINFGYNKIIILSAVIATNQEYNLHCNILINNDTTFEQYYDEVVNDLSNYNNLEYGYHNEEILRYVVLCWNVDNEKNVNIKQTYNAVTGLKPKIKKSNSNPHPSDNIRSFTSSSVLSKWYKGLINPISVYNKKGILKQQFIKPIFTMDLETMKFNNIELVVAISSCGLNNGIIENKIFLIDHKLLLLNSELAQKELWNSYFNYLENVINNQITIEGKLIIFAHNLGSFDGYFLFKGLMNNYNPDQISSIIDESNSFISIQHLGNPLIEWKDSLRIFPVSLDNLCKMFGVEGKVTSYNPEFNSIDLFNNPELLQTFIEYSLQDSKGLYDSLYLAQLYYFDKFKVDIESVYSTATLSLKVFRTTFQENPIYILNPNTDSFIRNSYYGGGTDVYQAYAENVHYYDVNSLYPFAMLNAMPHEILNNGKPIDLSNRTLDSFFGFALFKIVCPLNMLRPVLPVHHEGKTIYPVGVWHGTYFSEELKEVVKLGYQVTLIKGYEFSKFYPFNNYVNHFYNIKKNSTGVERNMAKLQLNNLYGYFGRKQIGLTTRNIHNNELNNVLKTRVIKSITPINNEYTTVLTYSNINYDLLEKLNSKFNSIGSDQHYIMSNVAIAAAVTSYARIIMIPFKLDPNTLYTDTDSAFTTKPINPNLLGLELGEMKDELKGQIINEAYFLGPKKYGYYIIDNVTNNKQEFSVFSGVPRNSLSFEEVKSIFEGKTIVKTIPNRFYKSFKSLNITIKDTKITIKNTSHKKLINNIYYPPVMNNSKFDLFILLYNKFKSLILKIINKYLPPLI